MFETKIWKYSSKQRFVALYLDELVNFKPIRDGHVKALEKFVNLFLVAVVNLQQPQMSNELGGSRVYIKLQKKLLENLLTN